MQINVKYISMIRHNDVVHVLNVDVGVILGSVVDMDRQHTTHSI